MKVVLTIAGSDSGGGAGIQADLKTMAALGVFSASAVTAVTAQNTVSVSRVHALPADVVRAQIRAVAEDFPLAAIKVGMLATREIALTVAEALAELAPVPVVVDPVCVAASGDRLLEPGALEVLKAAVLPRATVLTPNLPEAALLLGVERLGETDTELAAAARALMALGPAAVLIKGGHRSGDADDLFVDAEGVLVLEAERIAHGSSHGTGCSLASAIAALLTRGRSPREAVAEAKEFVRRSIEESVQLGKGQSNLHWFWEYYGNEGLPG